MGFWCAYVCACVCGVCVYVCMCMCAVYALCVCVCVCAGVRGFHHSFQVSRLSLYGHTGVLGSGRSPLVRPTVQARGASLCCPSTSAICTLRQNLAHCLRTTLEVGQWLHGFRRASSTVLVQRARHRHVALGVVCVCVCVCACVQG